MVLVAPRSAKLVETRGRPLHAAASATCSACSASLTMLLLWKEGSAYWQVGLGYAFIGVGVGFAGTPASHSLTGSVPVTRAGMASGTADLQRDLGGAIMQSIFGALLTAGYAAAVAAAIAAAPDRQQVTDERPDRAAPSRSRARRDGAQQYPQYSGQIIAGGEAVVPRRGRLGVHGRASSPSLLGAVLVFFLFPRKDREERCWPRTGPRTLARPDRCDLLLRSPRDGSGHLVRSARGQPEGEGLGEPLCGPAGGARGRARRGRGTAGPALRRDCPGDGVLAGRSGPGRTPRSRRPRAPCWPPRSRPRRRRGPRPAPGCRWSPVPPVTGGRRRGRPTAAVARVARPARRTACPAPPGACPRRPRCSRTTPAPCAAAGTTSLASACTYTGST